MTHWYSLLNCGKDLCWGGGLSNPHARQCGKKHWGSSLFTDKSLLLKHETNLSFFNKKNMASYTIWPNVQQLKASGVEKLCDESAELSVLIYRSQQTLTFV